MTNFRDTVIFNVGGADYQGLKVDGVTSMYNIRRDEWTEGPIMNIKRYAHA